MHRIIVRGASSGIRRAIAAWLLDDGYEVIGLGRTSPDLSHVGFRHVRADLTDLDAIGAVVTAIVPWTAWCMRPGS